MPEQPDTPANERLARLLGFHDRIIKLRAFEETVAAAAQDNKLSGLLHLGIGGEALTVGLFDRLNDSDRMYVAHRPHQQFLAGGVNPRDLFAELAGRETGLCRGRGGSMHLMSERVVLATGVVGGTLSIAVGHALTMPPGGIVVIVFGDGAVQTGAFHESVNLASLWKVPVLFVCENNGWVEFSAREEHTTVGAVSDYGPLYGLPASQVDGRDVEAVAAAVETALGPIRAGSGPALLEVFISRIRPHYEGDFRDQVDESDFLPMLRKTLVDLGANAGDLDDRYQKELTAMSALCESVLANDPLPDVRDDARLVFARTL